MLNLSSISKSRYKLTLHKFLSDREGSACCKAGHLPTGAVLSAGSQGLLPAAELELLSVGVHLLVNVVIQVHLQRKCRQ